jgi:hypothetical protein
MTAAEIADKTFDYLGLFGPALLIFFALAFAHKIIDLFFYALDGYRRRR